MTQRKTLDLELKEPKRLMGLAKKSKGGVRQILSVLMMKVSPKMMEMMMALNSVVMINRRISSTKKELSNSKEEMSKITSKMRPSRI